MAIIYKIYRILQELLISVLFMLIALQTVYASGVEKDNKNAIVVSTDGIAKVVDSDGTISLSPADRYIKKGEIKFGAIITNASIFKVNNVKRNQFHYRGGKICVNDNMNMRIRNFYLHSYDENQNNYCLVEIK